MPTSEARETQANLLYTPLRKQIEDLIRTHGSASTEVRAFIEREALGRQTPVEIDTVLYALVADAYRLDQDIRYAIDSLHYAVSDKREYRYGRGEPTWTLTTTEASARAQHVAETDSTYVGTKARKALDEYYEALRALEANQKSQRPLRNEYALRPWTRAFLVTDGHVHSSTECSTCFATTRFTWLTSLSGKEEAEIVELAGERACTVCYPSAPTLRSFEKASPLFTEEEAERAKQREQRAAEKAERQAKKIAKGLTEDGSEFVVITEEGTYAEDYYNERLRGQHYTKRETFKTEQAAVQWVVANRAGYGADKRSDQVKAAEQAILDAVVSKRVHLGLVANRDAGYDQVNAEISKKVEAKRRRDSRGY